MSCNNFPALNRIALLRDYGLKRYRKLTLNITLHSFLYTTKKLANR